LDLANIPEDFPVRPYKRFPVAAFEEPQVTANNGMAFLLQQINQVATDVAEMTCDKYFHGIFT
jgi:hypothetical protein